MDELSKKQQKIRFSGSGVSHQNRSAERSIKTVFTMSRTMLIHSALTCTEETLSTDLWTIEMNYVVWVYNWIHDMQSGLFDIEIYSKSRFDPVSEILINCHV